MFAHQLIKEHARERNICSLTKQGAVQSANHFLRGLLYSHTYHAVHYDVTMSGMASQITTHTSVYSTVYQRKHQSPASLAFVLGIHRDRWIPRTNGQLRGKCFHLMTSSCIANCSGHTASLFRATRRMQILGNILLAVFTSQFKFDGKFIWLSLEFWKLIAINFGT